MPSNSQTPQITEGLIRDILEKLKVNYGRYYDCINTKMKYFLLSQPEWDYLGLINQAATKVTKTV
jgi:transcription initiation factor IIE alpha subunit